MKIRKTRRDFLRDMMTGSGLVLGFSWFPFGCKVMKSEDGREDTAGRFNPNAWLKITPDNRVTVVVSQSEMGQGVYTSLPMIVADELDADWTTVRFLAAPATDAYVDPSTKMQFTGASRSVRTRFLQLRKAGATARSMLLAAAAETWGIERNECETRNGKVHHRSTGRWLSYGQLCDRASRVPVPDKPLLKAKSRFQLIGRSQARLDIPAKVQGVAGFGMDVRLPDMLIAVVAHPPRFGARVFSFSKDVAKAVTGVHDVVKIDRGIAVCAEGLEAAWKGREALAIRWGPGSHPDLDDEGIRKSFEEHLERRGASERDDSEVLEALSRATKQIEAEYHLPYLAHCAMEPMACTAHVQKDRCDVWGPTQSQTEAREEAARETGLDAARIHIHTTFLSGAFGRYNDTDVIREAVQISKAVGRPVKVVWTREEDLQNDFYRPGNSCRIRAGLDSKGHVKAWWHRIVAPSIASRVIPQWERNGIDPESIRNVVELQRKGIDVWATAGVPNSEYEIPFRHLEYVRSDLPIPVGFWRSPGNCQNGFTVECFIDELARLAGKDPLGFRLDHLKKHPRSRRVLEVVAEEAGWGGHREPEHGWGIARHSCCGSHAAHVAQVSVDPNTGIVKVHRMVCAIDCGPVINPDTIRAQMEGSIVMGLSTALMEKVRFGGGGVRSRNFDEYPIMRMKDVPAIAVHIVPSTDPIGGVGESGLPSVAPALANAVFDAIRIRFRRLPLDPQSVRTAIQERRAGRTGPA